MSDSPRAISPNLADYPPTVLNTIADGISHHVSTVDGYIILTERYNAAAHIIDALRSLPVEQRMEAMGMKPCAICADGKHWMEAEHG